MALAQLGYEVDFLTLPIGERREIPGVNIIRVPNIFLARNISIGPSALKAAFDVLLFFKAVALLHTRRYEVVHCVEDTGIIGVAVAWLGNARLVFEKHSDPSSYRNASSTSRNLIVWLYAKVERFTARHADAVIGTGPGLVEQVRAMHTGKPVHHIFDIPSSLVDADPARTHAIQARLKQSSREILATYVGSFASYQGIDLLFEAIPRAVKACPDIRFVIIGGSEHEIRERTAWLRERGAESAVTWAGWIAPDELANWLAASDILLSPRLTGVNTPLKLLDYLKAANAIVATDTPANRLLLDESNALLIAAEPEAFADGICRLAGDPDWRVRLATTGATLIRTRYNFDEFKRCLEKCYAELTPKAPMRQPNRRLLPHLAFSACLVFVLLEAGIGVDVRHGTLEDSASFLLPGQRLVALLGGQ